MPAQTTESPLVAWKTFMANTPKIETFSLDQIQEHPSFQQLSEDEQKRVKIGREEWLLEQGRHPHSTHTPHFHAPETPTAAQEQENAAQKWQELGLEKKHANDPTFQSIKTNEEFLAWRDKLSYYEQGRVPKSAWQYRKQYQANEWQKLIDHDEKTKKADSPSLNNISTEKQFLAWQKTWEQEHPNAQLPEWAKRADAWKFQESARQGLRSSQPISAGRLPDRNYSPSVLIAKQTGNKPIARSYADKQIMAKAAARNQRKLDKNPRTSGTTPPRKAPIVPPPQPGNNRPQPVPVSSSRKNLAAILTTPPSGIQPTSQKAVDPSQNVNPPSSHQEELNTSATAPISRLTRPMPNTGQLVSNEPLEKTEVIEEIPSFAPSFPQEFAEESFAEDLPAAGMLGGMAAEDVMGSDDPPTRSGVGGGAGGGLSSGGGSGGPHMPRPRNPFGGKGGGAKSLGKKAAKELAKKLAKQAVKQVASKALLNPYVLGAIAVGVLILFLFFFLIIIISSLAQDACNVLFFGGVANAVGALHCDNGSSSSDTVTVAKTGDPATTRGGDINYSISVSYPGSAGEITVSDPLPSGTTFSTCSDSCTNDSGTVTWHLTNFSGGTKNLSLQVHAPNTDTYVVNKVNTPTVTGSTGGTATPTPPGGNVPPNTNNCGGLYTEDLQKFIDSGFPSWSKNFGDPNCELLNDSNKVSTAIKQVESDTALAAEFYLVAGCESSYDANTWRDPNIVPHTPDPHGAWGLFQMGSSEPTPEGTGYGANGQYDRGDVEWHIQINNADNFYHTVLEPTGRALGSYWACAQ